MCTWTGAALLSEPPRSSSGSVNMDRYVIMMIEFVSRRVTAPDISLCLVLVLRNPWKKSVRGMSSPRLQHTTGGGLNASGASKPVLFTNKMQLWMNHRLCPTCWHMHPLTGGSTCLDTAGSSTRFMTNSHHLLFSPQHGLNVNYDVKDWIRTRLVFTHTGWLMQTVSAVQPSTEVDQVRAAD